MTPCACHCAACRAAGHGNTCVLLPMGLLRLFDGKSDIVDLVLRHYHGSSGWDTARFDAEIRSVQYGPAGDVIAAGDADGRIHLICALTGAKILCLKGHSLQVNSVSFSADGSLVASCSGNPIGGGDCRVRMWIVETGQELKKFLGHSDRVRCVKFHPTHAGQLVSGSDDRSVRLWDG